MFVSPLRYYYIYTYNIIYIYISLLIRYVGGDVEDIVRALLPAADGDVEMAEFGIIYIDEVPYHKY